jgi:hypothetical protein
MQKWEFAHVELYTPGMDSIFQTGIRFIKYGLGAETIDENIYRFLGQLGVEGWELVSFMTERESGEFMGKFERWIFKRLIE